MTQANNRMLQCNPRAGISHYFSDSFTHFGSIAMNRALRANRLFDAELAFFKPLTGIIQQLAAIIAKFLATVLMVSPAINMHHYRNGFLLAGKFIIYI